MCLCSLSQFSFPFPLSFFWFPLCARGGGGGGGARQEALAPFSPCRATPTGFFLSFPPLRLSGFLLFSFFWIFVQFWLRPPPERTPRLAFLSPDRTRMTRRRPGDRSSVAPSVQRCPCTHRPDRYGVSKEDLTDSPCLERAPSKD